MLEKMYSGETFKLESLPLYSLLNILLSQPTNLNIWFHIVAEFFQLLQFLRTESYLI